MMFILCSICDAELKFAFEVTEKCQQVTTLIAKSEKEKAQWMAALLSLLFR